MYKNEFDNLLRQNKTFSAYMFYGQSSFLIEHYALKVALSLASSDEIEKIIMKSITLKSAKINCCSPHCLLLKIFSL